jgi:GGDEF domain-containing protein
VQAGKIELEKARAEEEAQYQRIGALKEKKEGVRNEYPALIAQRNAARDEITKLYNELKQKRDAFQKLDAEWRKDFNGQCHPFLFLFLFLAFLSQLKIN